MSDNIKSPCISECHVLDGVCQGCYRTYDEISNWPGSTSERKEEILEAIKKRKNSVIWKKIKRWLAK
jgi:uncharacterized protein